MMKRIILLGLAAGLVGPALGADMSKKSLEDLMKILQSRGLLAKPYYNGVPDPIGRVYGEKKKPTRKEILAELEKINIPMVNDQNQWGNADMSQVIKDLSSLIAGANGGKGYNFFINPYMVAGGLSAGGNAGGGNAGGGNAGGGGIPPMGAGGLPAGMGGGFPGAGGGAPGGGGAFPGAPGGGGAFPGAGGAMPGGIQPALGQPQLGANGLPLPAPAAGIDGFGGAVTAGINNPGAFDPKSVKLQGFPARLENINALELMNMVVMSFDHPKGIQFNVMPYGIVFTQRSPNNVDAKSGAPLFTRKFFIKPNAFGGGLPAQPQGGGQQGGGMMGRPGMGGMGGMGRGGMMGRPMGGMMGGMNPFNMFGGQRPGARFEKSPGRRAC